MDSKPITYADAVRSGLNVQAAKKVDNAKARKAAQKANPLRGVQVPDLAQLSAMPLAKKVGFYTSLSLEQIDALPHDIFKDYALTYLQVTGC